MATMMIMITATVTTAIVTTDPRYSKNRGATGWSPLFAFAVYRVDES